MGFRFVLAIGRRAVTEPLPEGLPDTVRAANLARLLSLSERRLQQLAREGVLPRAGRGVYPFAESIRAYVDYLQQTGVVDGVDPDRLEPFKRRAHYQAEVEKLTLGVKSRELIQRAEVEREFARICDVMARFLDVLPDRLERAELVDAAASRRVSDWARQSAAEMRSTLLCDPAGAPLPDTA